MGIKRLALITLLGASLTACAGMRPEPPQVQLAGLEITEVSLSHANFLATLALFNPNNAALAIEGIKFTLFLNDIRIARGVTTKSFSIPAEESSEAVIRLSSSFLDLLRLTRSLQGQNQITFHLAGEVKIGGVGLFGATLPIDREGTLPLSGSLNQLVPGPQQLQPMSQPGDPPLRQ